MPEAPKFGAVVPAGWTLDTLLTLLRQNGAEIGEDNDGQVVIYTGYRERKDGCLVMMK